MLVPGGGLAADGRTWLRVPRRRKAFIVPEKALAKHFRGRFIALARRAMPNITLPESVCSKPWITFAKPVVHGAERVLEYLGRYVHRTALSGKALLAADDQHVTFRYRDSRDGQHKTMTLPVAEFCAASCSTCRPRAFIASARSGCSTRSTAIVCANSNFCWGSERPPFRYSPRSRVRRRAALVDVPTASSRRCGSCVGYRRSSVWSVNGAALRRHRQPARHRQRATLSRGRSRDSHGQPRTSEARAARRAHVHPR
jgi:hypothetical protein